MDDDYPLVTKQLSQALWRSQFWKARKEAQVRDVASKSFVRHKLES